MALLGDSLARRVKEQLRDKIDALDDISVVYTFIRIPPEQWPAVFITYGDIDGEFSSNTHNQRTYSFRVTLMYQIGHDLHDVTHERMQYGEEAVGQTVESILNQIETDYDLGNLNAEVLFVRAMDVTHDEAEFEGGYAKRAQFNVDVVTEHNVSS